ncbi:hypothetical protein QFZ27_001262 [Inquilinus ginsengisoli]|uniref:hypothetical protein n=1 Tax=Inquilinus ginsengisoli TaxID=363840 RepID=UPI003D1D7A14
MQGSNEQLPGSLLSPVSPWPWPVAIEPPVISTTAAGPDSGFDGVLIVTLDRRFAFGDPMAQLGRYLSCGLAALFRTDGLLADGRCPRDREL